MQGENIRRLTLLYAFKTIIREYNEYMLNTAYSHCANYQSWHVWIHTIQWLPAMKIECQAKELPPTVPKPIAESHEDGRTITLK